MEGDLPEQGFPPFGGRVVPQVKEHPVGGLEMLPTPGGEVEQEPRPHPGYTPESGFRL